MEILTIFKPLSTPLVKAKPRKSWGFSANLGIDNQEEMCVEKIPNKVIICSYLNMYDMKRGLGLKDER